MSRWVKVVLGVVVAGAAAAYAEFCLDIRGPRSEITALSAMGASGQITLDWYYQRRAELEAAYGKRADISYDQSGMTTVSLDGKVIETHQIPREFAGMYGLFVVRPPGKMASIFPFAWTPGETPSEQDHEPNLFRLNGHFSDIFAAQNIAFTDLDWSRDSCVAMQGAKLLPVGLASSLRLDAQTFCITRWNGAQPSAMLIGITRASGDPWMRPFARAICRKIMTAALQELVPPDRQPPPYAGCVLVDRPDRTGPTGSQEAFTAEAYEVRNWTLARMAVSNAVLERRR